MLINAKADLNKRIGQLSPCDLATLFANKDCLQILLSECRDLCLQENKSKNLEKDMKLNSLAKLISYFFENNDRLVGSPLGNTQEFWNTLKILLTQGSNLISIKSCKFGNHLK